MIIMGIDVAYSSLGYSIFDTTSKELLYSSCIKFNSLSALNQEEKKLFDGLFEPSFLHKTNIKSLDDKVKRELKDYWNNIRLRVFYEELRVKMNKYNIEAIVSESQFSEISDVFAITRLLATYEHNRQFKSFMPSNWYKLLYGKGKLKKEEAKDHTKSCLVKLGYDFKVQDQYDSLALCYAYCSYKNLLTKEEKGHFLI